MANRLGTIIQNTSTSDMAYLDKNKMLIIKLDLV